MVINNYLESLKMMLASWGIQNIVVCFVKIKKIMVWFKTTWINWSLNPKTMDDKTTPTKVFIDLRETPKDEDVYSKDDDEDIWEKIKAFAVR